MDHQWHKYNYINHVIVSINMIQMESDFVSNGRPRTQRLNSKNKNKINANCNDNDNSNDVCDRSGKNDDTRGDDASDNNGLNTTTTDSDLAVENLNQKLILIKDYGRFHNQ